MTLQNVSEQASFTGDLLAGLKIFISVVVLGGLFQDIGTREGYFRGQPVSLADLKSAGILVQRVQPFRQLLRSRPLNGSHFPKWQRVHTKW
jgi:hypothetical protein